MVDAAWGGAGDADVVALLVDARKGIDEEAEAILDKLPELKRPKVLVLNKIDRIERAALLELAAKLNEQVPFAHTFMISALTGDGVDDLKRHLAAPMPEGPWLYPEDQISDAPLRLLAAEITREKIYERLHEELPYDSTVETDQWQERTDGSVRIEQTDLCRARQPAQDRARQGRPDHQGDLQAARKEIAEIAETPGAPLPVREGARELGRRSRALPRDGPGVPPRLSFVCGSEAAPVAAEDADGSIHLLHHHDLAAAHVAGIGLHDERPGGARGRDAGAIVENPLVACIGGVPHRIARPLGLRIDPVVDRDVAVAVDREAEGHRRIRGKSILENGRQQLLENGQIGRAVLNRSVPDNGR